MTAPRVDPIFLRDPEIGEIGAKDLGLDPRDRRSDLQEDVTTFRREDVRDQGRTIELRVMGLERAQMPLLEPAKPSFVE